jgi:hypothetical protein
LDTRSRRREVEVAAFHARRFQEKVVLDDEGTASAIEEFYRSETPERRERRHSDEDGKDRQCSEVHIRIL